MELYEENDDVNSDPEMKVGDYHNMNDSHQEVLGCYSKVQNGEEVTNEVKKKPDQISGFYTVELNSEAVLRSMDNSGKIDDQMPYSNTGECNSEVVLRTDRQEVDDQLPNMDLFEPKSYKEEALNTLVLSFVEHYVETSAKVNKIGTNESEHTDENSISADEGPMDTEEGFVTKINGYIDNLVKSIGENINNKIDTIKCIDTNEDTLSEDEGIYQMFPGEGYDAETNQTIQDILQSSEENYLYKKNEKEIFIISKRGRVDDTEDTISVDKVAIYQISAEANDYITNEVGINESEQDICLITEGTETNGKAAEENSTDEMEIYEKSAGENYVTVDDITNQSGINESSEREIYLITDGTETHENKDEQTLKPNIHFVNKKRNGNISECKDSNEYTVRADEIKKYQTSAEENDDKVDDTTNEVPVIIEEREGKEKIYEILSSQGPWEVACLSMHDDIITEMQTNIVTGKKKNISARKPSSFKTVSKKINEKAVTKNVDTIENVYVTQKDGNILYKVRKKDVVICGIKTIEEGTLRESVQSVEMSISRILCVEINKKTGKKFNRFKEFIVARKDGYEKVYNILDSKNKVRLAQPKNSKKNKKKTKKNKKKTKKNKKKTKKNKMKTKKNKKKANKITKKIKKHKESKSKTCEQQLPSNEEELAIGNLVDYFVEEQISNVCFDFHRAAKFEYFCEDIPKDDENYATNKIPCCWCKKSHTDLDVIQFLEHFKTEGSKRPKRKAKDSEKNYSESGRQPGKKRSAQEKESNEIVLTPREPTGPPMIKKLSALKQVLLDLENKELLPKTKIPVDVSREEKGLTGQKLSKEKDTIKRKLNCKKIASSLSENSNSQVEKYKEESKKKMHGSNQGEDEVIELIESQETDFEKYQRCLKEIDQIVKQKIKELQSESDKVLTTYIHLLEQKKILEKEETTSGSFSENIEKAKEEQKNEESKKTDVEGIMKNKEIDKTLLENIEKNKQKKKSKKQKKEKSPEINEKVTIEGGKADFLPKSKKMKRKEATYLLSIVEIVENMIKNKSKSKIVSKQEPVLRERKREESTNSDSSSNQKFENKLIDVKLKVLMEKQKAIETEIEQLKNIIVKQPKKNNKSRQKMDALVLKKSEESKKNEKQSEEKKKNVSVKRSKQKRIEKSVERKKEKKTKIKEDSVLNPYISLNNEANTSIDWQQIAILNNKAILELGIGNERQERQKQKQENQKKEEEKSKILDGTEEIPNNSLQKRKYDWESDEGSDENDSNDSDVTWTRGGKKKASE